MLDPALSLSTRLTELREGLRRNDPVFRGTAPAWVVEMVLENLDTLLVDLEAAEDRPRQAELVRAFALGGIRFVADQDAAGSDRLLESLGDLLVMEGS